MDLLQNPSRLQFSVVQNVVLMSPCVIGRTFRWWNDKCYIMINIDTIVAIFCMNLDPRGLEPLFLLNDVALMMQKFKYTKYVKCIRRPGSLIILIIQSASKKKIKPWNAKYFAANALEDLRWHFCDLSLSARHSPPLGAILTPPLLTAATPPSGPRHPDVCGSAVYVVFAPANQPTWIFNKLSVAEVVLLFRTLFSLTMNTVLRDSEKQLKGIPL